MGWKQRKSLPFYPPKSPPLLYAATTGSTPFRFNLHCGDIGHTFMVVRPAREINIPGIHRCAILPISRSKCLPSIRATSLAC